MPNGLELIVDNGHIHGISEEFGHGSISIYLNYVLNLYQVSTGELKLDPEVVQEDISYLRKLTSEQKRAVYRHLLQESREYKSKGMRNKSDLLKEAATYLRKEFMPELTEKFARFTVHDGKKPK